MASTVAVVIPAFNVAPYIEATLKSVFAQSVPPDEIIVIDNNSKDQTVDIVKKFPVRFLEEKKKGAGAARNCGIKAATSDWISFLDGDDQFYPEKIKKLKHTIEMNPDAVLIAHDEVEGPLEGPFVEKKLHRYFDANKPALPQLFERCFLSTCTVSVRRDVLEQVGGFNEAFILSQDYELWMRVVQKGKIVFIPETLALYLLRPQSNSENIPLRHQFVMQIVEQHRRSVPRILYYKRVLKLLAETTLALLRKKQRQAAFRIFFKGSFEFIGLFLRSFR